MQKKLLQIKDFRLLLFGQTVCVFGDWFGIISIIALIGFRWQVMPWQMSLAIFSLAAPIFFFGPIGGVIADRVERGRMLAFLGVIRAIVLFFVASSTNYYFLIGLLLLLGTFDACFLPAKNAKLKECVPEEMVADATIYSSFIDQGSKILGPLLSGVFLSVFSIEFAIYLNAFAYALSSIAFLFFDKTVKLKSEDKEKTSIKKEFIDGLKLINDMPLVMYGALVQVFVIIVLQIVDSQFVILLRTIEGATESWVGYCLMTSGVGAVFTTYFYLKKHKSDSMPKSMFLGTLIYSISVIGLGFWGMLGHSPWGFLPFFFLWGASGALIFVKYVTYVQTTIPTDFSGRTFGSLGSMLSAASIVGLISGGLLVSFFGVINTFLFAGVMMFLGSVLIRTKMYR